MKYLLVLVIFLASILGAYYAGQRVSSDYVWTQCYALDASHAASVISARYPEDISLKKYRDGNVRSHVSMLKEGIIGQGRFESTISSKMPFLVGDKEFAMSMLGMAFSKYPEIQNFKLTKLYPEEDSIDVFQNNRVDWFYNGLNSIKESEASLK